MILRGESGVGTWTIIVKDTAVNDHNGKFIDWHLKLWGESIDPSKAKLLPMPTEEDDKDHAAVPTTTLPASTTKVPVATQSEAAPTGNPSDHPDRPVNSKPTDTTTSTSTSATTTSATSATTSSAPETTPTAPSTWLPSFLPTFGVSASTQAWIYGSAAMIAVFCSGLGVYFYMARRRRLRNGEDHADYEFELLDEEEAQGLNSGEKNSAAAGNNGRGRRTRGGELYDAFAGGSDDDEDDEYRDRAYDAVMGGNDEAHNEKRKNGRSDGDESEEESDHHVVGDDEDVDEDEDRPLRR